MRGLIKKVFDRRYVRHSQFVEMTKRLDVVEVRLRGAQHEAVGQDDLRADLDLLRHQVIELAEDLRRRG